MDRCSICKAAGSGAWADWPRIDHEAFVSVLLLLGPQKVKDGIVAWRNWRLILQKLNPGPMEPGSVSDETNRSFRRRRAPWSSRNRRRCEMAPYKKIHTLRYHLRFYSQQPSRLQFAWAGIAPIGAPTASRGCHSALCSDRVRLCSHRADSFWRIEKPACLGLSFEQKVDNEEKKQKARDQAY